MGTTASTRHTLMSGAALLATLRETTRCGSGTKSVVSAGRSFAALASVSLSLFLLFCEEVGLLGVILWGGEGRCTDAATVCWQHRGEMQDGGVASCMC
jgi:hypothetical protein